MKAFVRQQVADGVQCVAEMQRHTEAYVRNVLFAGKHLPSRLNRRFYPTRRDYSNMIYRARLSETFSCIDEDNLVEKLKVWSERLPDQSFYFRKCVNSSESDLQVDSDGNILICSRGKTGLLFIHQTAWQKKLLAKYGGLCLLDATYRTTRYAVPLFFLCVKTNVDYVVVATFITQFEDSSSIAEALQMLNQWNQDWTPRSFMVDFSEAEILALNQVFPGMVN